MNDCENCVRIRSFFLRCEDLGKNSSGYPFMRINGRKIAACHPKCPVCKRWYTFRVEEIEGMLTVVEEIHDPPRQLTPPSPHIRRSNTPPPNLPPDLLMQ